MATANVAAFTLAAGQVRTDVDFGYRYGSAGDRVWFDTDGDGVQDAGEPGLNGLTVQLLNSGGTVIATTTTAGDGNYTFGNLAAGNYSVRVSSTLPSGIIPSYDLDGVATPHVAAFTLTAGQNRTDVDFGYKFVSCVIRAGYDPDYMGAAGGHAFWFPGIATDLVFFPDPGSMTFTSDGSFRLTGSLKSIADPNKGFTVDVTFTGATFTPPSGSPKKEFPASAYSENGGPVNTSGWLYYPTFTGTLTGTGTWAGAKVNIVRAGPAFQVGNGANNKNLNFGGSGWFTWTVTQQPTAGGSLQTTGQGDINVDMVDCSTTGSVGDRVWTDTNGNGVQDSGEAGINGVTVQLIDSEGAVMASTVTAGNGNYTFSGLPAGNYTVKVVSSTLPAGQSQTYDLDGTGTAHMAAFSLTAGQNRTDVDFGYRATYSVGDRVWKDTDGDGVQDSGEAGLSNVTVQLLSGSTVVATDVTDSNGIYGFSGLAGGTYTVKVVSSGVPSGYVQTYDLDGVASAHQATFSLTANRTDVDFGYKPPVTCTAAGTFKDTFTSASFSNNEGSLSWSAAWVESDSAGSGVNNGNVTVGNPVSGYLILNDSPDTGTQPSAARQMNLTGFASATLTMDFHIRGVETDDAAVIEVSKDGGSTYTVLETFTGITGTYISSRTFDLSSYIASNTRIRFRITNNYGGDDDFFKVDMVQVGAACTPPAPPSYAIGDRVWKDTDGDGVQESGENGISGVTVQLLNSGSTVIATDTTDSAGSYGFSGITAGSYTVKVVSGSLPSGYTQTFDLDGVSSAHQASFSLSANRSDVDFGYKQVATCTASGSFKDTFTTASFSNNEGSLSWSAAWVESDSAGSGVNNGNVTVGNPVGGYLILNDSPDTGTQPSAARQANLSSFGSASLSVDIHLRGVETDDAAVIEVSNNGGSTYTVLETFTGYTGTYISPRVYDISDFIASNTRIRFRIVTNFGGSDDYFKIDQVRIDGSCTPAAQLGSVGDRVWKDNDRDGAQDSGEAGLSDVTVQLQNSSGTVLATTETDINGYYRFTNLAAATYKVKVATVPSGYVPTYDKDGTSTANIATLSVSAGQDRTDVDFGYDN